MSRQRISRSIAAANTGMSAGRSKVCWIEGASHVDLYDKDPYIIRAVAKLADFFRAL